MLAFHLQEDWDGIVVFIAVDDLVMNVAEQDEIIETVPSLIILCCIMSWSSRFLAFDVADLSHNRTCLDIDKRSSACMERAAITG